MSKEPSKNKTVAGFATSIAALFRIDIDAIAHNTLGIHMIYALKLLLYTRFSLKYTVHFYILSIITLQNKYTLHYTARNEQGMMEKFGICGKKNRSTIYVLFYVWYA